MAPSSGFLRRRGGALGGSLRLRAFRRRKRRQQLVRSRLRFGIGFFGRCQRRKQVVLWRLRFRLRLGLLVWSVEIIHRRQVFIVILAEVFQSQGLAFGFVSVLHRLVNGGAFLVRLLP